MHDLRLIGVHADGIHLLLVDDSGERYRVPIDEALRAAARRDRPRLGQIQIEMDNSIRPKDIQQMIRQGMTAEEVAERTGWPVEKVIRYEGPVVAEREYYASRAQRVPLRITSKPGARSRTETLIERVESRLVERGVERDLARWDSARTHDGHWTVSVEFPAGGRSRVASWFFDPQAMTVVPRNDEARWLTEEVEDGVIPSPHTARPDTPVYDVEATGGLRHRPDPADLITTMKQHSGARSRRGRRRGPGAEPKPEPAPPPETKPTPEAEPAAARPTPKPEAKPRKGRPSVPSWDDVMFGGSGRS
ncbi:septation protein SepH [Kribbia dieselivorans]|uniref:septation protein SepH n=1 Tax=Kribbia dieselivorans TaxID=331526 RepID=UPI0008396044|nr:septation protein SepH [Kribbia dieselivorans]